MIFSSFAVAHFQWRCIKPFFVSATAACNSIFLFCLFLFVSITCTEKYSRRRPSDSLESSGAILRPRSPCQPVAHLSIYLTNPLCLSFYPKKIEREINFIIIQRVQVLLYFEAQVSVSGPPARAPSHLFLLAHSFCTAAS